MALNCLKAYEICDSADPATHLRNDLAMGANSAINIVTADNVRPLQRPASSSS